MTEYDLSTLELIKHLKDTLPPICTTRNLLDIGMYKTANLACVSRKRGKGPKSVYVPDRGYVYDRDEVIQYVIENEKKKCSRAVREKEGCSVQWTAVLEEHATRKHGDLSGPQRKKISRSTG